MMTEKDKNSRVIEQSFEVTGMTCAVCASHVQKATERLEGVLQSDVNLATEKLTVKFDLNLVDFEKLTGSEDFSFLMDEAPGIYGFLGARSDKVPGSELSNHHECFTVDEDALHHGSAIAAQFAYDFLNR